MRKPKIAKIAKKDYSRLSVLKLPIPKRLKSGRRSRKKVGGLLSNKKITQPVSFRLRVEVNDVLKEIVRNVNMNSKMHFTLTDVVEMLILYSAQQDCQELIHSYVDEDM